MPRGSVRPHVDREGLCPPVAVFDEVQARTVNQAEIRRWRTRRGYFPHGSTFRREPLDGAALRRHLEDRHRPERCVVRVQLDDADLVLGPGGSRLGRSRSRAHASSQRSCAGARTTRRPCRWLSPSRRVRTTYQPFWATLRPSRSVQIAPGDGPDRDQGARGPRARDTATCRSRSARPPRTPYGRDRRRSSALRNCRICVSAGLTFMEPKRCKGKMPAAITRYVFSKSRSAGTRGSGRCALELLGSGLSRYTLIRNPSTSGLTTTLDSKS